MSTVERRHSTNFKRFLTNYFRLTALEDDVTFIIDISSNLSIASFVYLDYSINEGKTWTRIINRDSLQITTNIANIKIGDSVLLRGKGTTLSRGIDTNRDLRIRANKKYSVSGLLMSLLYGRSATENTLLIETPVTAQRYAFKALFSGSTTLVDASDLILPKNSCEYCYFSMFSGCTALTKAPYLPALTIAYRAYEFLFLNCSSLTYVKVNALNNIGSNSNGWMKSPLPNLEFHRNSEATWWVTGANGIPAQCTLFDDTEESAEDYTFIDSEAHRVILANWGNRKPLGAVDSWKNSIRIGGVDGKILKRLLSNVTLIKSQFARNANIVDLSDFDKFENLLYIGSTNLAAYYGLSVYVGFYNCTSLKYITLPNTLKSLAAAYTYSKGCFMNTAIEEIYIPDSVEAASDLLFLNCSQLKTVRWSSNLPFRVNTTSYWSRTFNSCVNLETLTNYPNIATTLAAEHFNKCGKLDFTSGLIDFRYVVTLSESCLRECTLLPTTIVFYSARTLGNYVYRQSSVRYLYFPVLLSITNYTFSRTTLSLLDLGELITSIATSGGSSEWYAMSTIVLRTKTSLSISGLYWSKVSKFYVYEDIIDTVKSTYPSNASKIFKIGGEEWFTDFGSYYEYADYPMSDTVVFDEATDNSISIDFPIYNPDVTFNLYFNGSNYRSIVLPFADIEWEQARMGGDEMKEITGVTATVDGAGNLTGFTVLYTTATTIVANKPYIITSGMNGAGVGNNDYSESLIAYGVVLKTTPTTDEFTSNGYKFSFTGTYELIDNMEGKYAFNGTDWVLCTSANTMKPTYVYLEITKIEE